MSNLQLDDDQNENLSFSYIYTGGDGERVPCKEENVTYAAGISTIKAKAAYDCKGITSVIHPDSIIVIEGRAYSNCFSIEHLRLSASLQTIGVNSFSCCRSITRLELPSSLHTINREGFGYCKSLRVIVPQQQHKPLSLERIAEEAFQHCKSLASIPFLPFLATIEPVAFRGCSSLTEVTLGPSVTSAARNSFEDCNHLEVLECTYRTHSILPWAVTHVTLHPDTTHIHTSAFAGCDRLRSLVLTPAVTSLGPSCFWGCNSLPSDFVVLNTVKEVGIGAFARCRINLANLPPHATHDIYTFMGGEGEMAPRYAEKVVVDETVQMIVKGDFEYEPRRVGPGFTLGARVMYNRLSQLNIQSKSIRIRPGAFSHCGNLEGITFHPEGTFEIEEKAFDSSKLSLSKIVWPNAMKWIVEANFGEHTSLGNRPTIPMLDVDTFCKDYRPSNVFVQYCKKYSQLADCWNWIIHREVKHEKDQKDKQTNPNSCQSEVFTCLCKKDIKMLRQVCEVVPPPKDLIDAIVNDLHSFDITFSKIPKDIIWKVVGYIS